MGRPKNKAELKELSNSNFQKLMELVEDKKQVDHSVEFPAGYLNRNIKDVIAHLHEWHNMFLTWYKEGMKGVKPHMPKEGYTWKTLPDLNREIWNTYKDHKLEDVVKKLKSSHSQMESLIDGHSNEDLFTKKKYKWTGSTSMGAYLISATSSHYDWAIKLIKKCTKI